MTDRQLFDPTTTTSTVCKACGATREPGEEKAPTCAADRDRDQYRRRPHQCLNRYDPATSSFPEGY